MKNDPFLSDEPSLAPATPGAALVRLSQLLGALKDEGKANIVPISVSVPKWRADIEACRAALLDAVESSEGVAAGFANAQTLLRGCYAALAASQPEAEAQALLLTSFGFPDPRRNVDTWVQPIDTRTVVATHFMPERQVLTTLAFDEAHGATAYWLSEVRFFGDERLEDAVVENYAPQFTRLRLPVGLHRFFIESRNPHRAVRSEEFEIEVPELS